MYMTDKEIRQKAIKNTILVMLCLVLLAVLAFWYRNFSIIAKLQELSFTSKNHENYQLELVKTTGAEVQLSNIYVKGNYFLSSMQTVSTKDDSNTILTYRDPNERLMISEKEKVVIPFSEEAGFGLANVYTCSDFFENANLLHYFTYLITSENCNNVDCYKIEMMPNAIIWAEKTTGIIIQELNVNTLTYCHYTFDTVTDQDVKKPNLEGYITANTEQAKTD